MIARIESQPTIPVQHVSWFTTFQNYFAGRPTIRRERQFSLLRVFSLAGLFVSARCQLFPAVIELSSLDGTTGFTLNGDQAGDRSGWSVSEAGDVNGDGVSDLLIGARLADPAPGRANAGKTYVVFGRSGLGTGGTLELSSLDGTTGFILNGDKFQDRSGRSVSSAGDVNGDGVGDLIIGAYYADPASGRDQAGQSYVVFGRPGLGSGGTLELSSLEGATGFILNGASALDYSGNSISSAGDVNGDGVSDLLIGAHRAEPATGRERAGKTYVVFGRKGLGTGGTLELSSLNGTAGFIFNGVQADDESGNSVSSAGDVNGDGLSDLLIGAWQADPVADREFAGKTYVVFGRTGLGTGGTLELSSLDGTTGFTLNGEQGNDQSGYSVSSAGDVNGDGVSDLLIGTYNAAPATGRGSAGKTYVVFGRRSGTLSSPPLAATSAMASLPPSSTPRRVDITTLTQRSPATKPVGVPQSSPSASSLPTVSGQTPLASSDEPPIALPLGIAGGICAVISSVVAAVLALRHRRQTPTDEQQNPPSEYAVIDSLGLLPSNYDQVQRQPTGHTHYVGDKELQVLNREQAQYESTKAAKASRYASPQPSNADHYIGDAEL